MKTGNRIRLLILAGGPTAPFEKMVDHLGLRDIILIKENEAAVEDFVQAADAGLYTSDYESFGLSILETLYFGKPVVAFQVGGIPEVVGESYPLYPFPDTSALARAMDELVESPELAARLGEQGRRHVLQTFAPMRSSISTRRFTRRFAIVRFIKPFDCRAGAPPAILAWPRICRGE